MRVEFTDLAFSIAERAEGRNDEPTPDALYLVIVQTLGIAHAAAQPSSGFRLRTQKYLVEAPWQRFYDVVLRVRQELLLRERGPYHDNINKLLAAYGIVWQLTERGQFERVLPEPVAAGVRATIDELRRPEYAATRQLFEAALDAFNAIPRRERDAGANAFDAMESAAKIRLGLPTATFGNAIGEARRRRLLHEDVLQVMERLNTLRHHHLGHGMTDPFNLRPDEVDFVYVTCAAGIRLFARV
jgi:hypothetical protein